MNRPSLPLAVTMGDPAGVGPQLTWKAWGQRKPGQRPFYAIAAPEVLRSAQTLAGVDGALRVIGAPEDAADVFGEALPVLPIASPAPTPGAPDPETAPAIINAIRMAVEDVQAGRAAADLPLPSSLCVLYLSKA